MITRRQALLALPAIAAAAGPVQRRPGTRLRLGLNAYSFNKPLLAGAMTLYDVIDYCAQQGIDGADLTGYYFPGYPDPPADESLFKLKRHAFLNGVTISGTGVRNDFTLPDAASRRGQVQLVKNWIDVAAKLGSDMVRVFTGRELPKGHTFDQVFEWMIPAFRECAEYGGTRGVIVGLQNHHDYAKTAAETIRIADAVRSDWFSVILDVGSLRMADPYEEIEKLLPYASNWQIKEHVWHGEKRVPIDLARLKRIIDKTGYRGFTPIEALGEGDPAVIVTAFLSRVRKAFTAGS